MSKITSTLLSAALATVAVVSLAACTSGSSGSDKSGSAAPRSSSSASSSSNSSASTSEGTPDAAVVGATYATDAEVCSAAFKSTTGIQSELATAMTGDPSKAVTALQNLSATYTGLTKQLKSTENTQAFETLSTFYLDYSKAIASKDAKKISDLQSEVTAKGGTVNAASERLGKCVVGQ